MRLHATTDELGARLAYLRQQRGMSQRELARRLGVSNTHISRVEAGATEPSLTLLRAWATECEAPVGFLFDVGTDSLLESVDQDGDPREQLAKALIELMAIASEVELWTLLYTIRETVNLIRARR